MKKPQKFINFGKLARKVAIRVIRFLFDRKNLYKDIVLSSRSFHQPLKVSEMKNMLASSKKHIPYYKNNFPELEYDLRDNTFLQQFENTNFEINKKVLKEDIKKFLNPELLKTENILDYKNDSFFSILGKLFKNFSGLISTSGSTGSPLYFYKSKESALRIFYKMAQIIKYFGWKEGENIGYIQQSGTMPYMNAIKKYASIVGLSFFYPDIINKKSTIEFMKFLENKKPTALHGFPSILSEYAIYIKQNNKPPMHSSLKFILSGSEVLFEHQRKLLQEVFNCPVYNFYGAIETGVLAGECEYQNGMHVFEDLAFIENNKNNEILITTLTQAEMPLIRYNIGDRGYIKEEKCACGIFGKKVYDLEGRVEEYLLNSIGEKVYGSYFRQLISIANKKFGDQIVNSQIMQKSNKEIEYKLQLRNFHDLQSKEIIIYISKYITEKMQLKVKGSIIESLNTGKKLQFLVRE